MILSFTWKPDRAALPRNYLLPIDLSQFENVGSIEVDNVLEWIDIYLSSDWASKKTWLISNRVSIAHLQRH